jgi:hypothetical protein
MRVKRWTARHVAQRTATLTRKAQHYTARLAEIGEPQDRHQSRTVSMARRSLKRAQDELATLAAFGVENRHVIRLLIEVARAAFTAADNTEDAGDPEFVKMDRAGYDALSAELDKLDDLPDDQPGYTMSGPARAEWALRVLLANGAEASDKSLTGERP